MKIKMYCNGMGPFEYEAVEMSMEQFDAIKEDRDTPDLVAVGGRVFYNDYTCLAGYSGTCKCMSHPKKSWCEYFPETLHWGKVVFSL